MRSADSASSAAFLTRSILLSARNSGCWRSPSERDDPLDLGVHPRRGIDHQQDEVGILRAGPGRRDHRPVEPTLGLEDARRVDQQDLRFAWMAMPISRARVVCALALTIATFCPTSALTSVDLPALGAPITATKPARVGISLIAVVTASAAGGGGFRLLLARCLRRSLRRASGTDTRIVNFGAWWAPVRPTTS